MTELGDELKVLPKYFTVPPLMKQFLIRYKEEKGEPVDSNKDFEIPFVFLNAEDAQGEKGELFWLEYRIAADGEEPDLKFDGKYTFYDRYTNGLKTDV